MPAPRRPVDPPIVGNRPTARGMHGTRMQRLSLVIMLVGLALITYCVVARAAYPLFVIHSEDREMSALRAQLDSERARNLRLKARYHYLMTQDGAQAEARKQGWVKKGEVPFRLEDPPKPAAAP